SVALTADGRIVTWGDNRDGQRNDLPTGSGYTAIAAGAYHSIALRTPVVPAVTGTPPTATAGEPYSFAFTTTGTPAPTVTHTGDLPSGLTLSPDGTLTGTPTTGGRYPFTVTATNSAGTADLPVTLEIHQAPVFDPVPDLVADFGEPFEYRITATGYPTPRRIDVGGFVPGGIRFEGHTLRGTPTSSGSFAYIFTAITDAGTTELTVPIEVRRKPAVTPAAPPAARIGEPYEFQFTAVGHPKPTFTGTELPDGLILSPEGLLSGTPTTTGTFTVAGHVDNTVGTAQFDASLTVEQAAVITGTPDAAQVDQPYEFRFTTSGFPAPTVTLTGGDLPDGITLAPDGALTGTPTKSGTYTFTVTATSSAGTADHTVTLEVTEQPAPSSSTASANLSASTVDLARFLVKFAVLSVETASGSVSPR
ncbi:putative Ig domain-containing protein, partial [Prescottella defluvii]